jgi:hypothetical protein
VGLGGADDGYTPTAVLEDAGNSYMAIAGGGSPLPFIRPQEPGENVILYAAHVGLTIMEHARRELLPPSDEDPYPRYIVGGGVDMTIVNPDGVETTRIRDWPDKIGEPINPFAEAELKRGARP